MQTLVVPGLLVLFFLEIFKNNSLCSIYTSLLFIETIYWSRTSRNIFCFIQGPYSRLNDNISNQKRLILPNEKSLCQQKQNCEETELLLNFSQKMVEGASSMVCQYSLNEKPVVVKLIKQQIIKIKILSQAALGLQYLHNEDIIQ